MRIRNALIGACAAAALFAQAGPSAADDGAATGNKAVITYADYLGKIREKLPELRRNRIAVEKAGETRGTVFVDNANRATPAVTELPPSALAVSNVLGVTGQLKMNPKRNVDKPAVVQEVTYANGAVTFVYKATVSPN